MIYIGMDFKNCTELREWTKQGKIGEYKRLAKMFADKASMEISVKMSEAALVLHDQFGLEWDEIEAMEIAALA